MYKMKHQIQVMGSTTLYTKLPLEEPNEGLDLLGVQSVEGFQIHFPNLMPSKLEEGSNKFIYEFIP